MNIFLKTFARNINAMNEEGISCTINNSLRRIRLYPICCCVDTSARALMQGIIQFNGYFGCNWCLHPGVPVKHKKKKVVKYPLLDYLPQKRSVYDTHILILLTGLFLMKCIVLPWEFVDNLHAVGSMNRMHRFHCHGFFFFANHSSWLSFYNFHIRLLL
jgi:hypothetical protein